MLLPIAVLFCWLCTITAQNDEPIMFPNKRTSLDDCHLRYFKLERSSVPGPAFGQPTLFKEFPHMAAIGWTQPGSGSIRWQCGGSLIWDNFVLTAAHCAVDTTDRAPDIVRLGDLNLFSSEDDRYSQQFNIVDIIRHPQHRFMANYHDIALLKLDRNAIINFAVIPACLWIDEEVRFKTLVATGWGRTGFGYQQTPNLLKVLLKPIQNRECSKFYPISRVLMQGLQDQHLCAVDEKMDTCEGDSGGPLQVKLLHNSKMTPFVVGITSFGVACGTSTPGVYTKVAPYYGWIVSTMRERGAAVDELTYNETFCAIRYTGLREFDDRIVLYKSENSTTIDPSKVRIQQWDGPQQMVKIEWSSTGPDCYGVILDEDTVLTIADCVNYNGSPPRNIRYLKDNVMNISLIYIHPGNIRGSGYNNIAILKMAKLLDLPLTFQPSCIWHRSEINLERMNVYGLGRRDINEFVGFFDTPSIDPTKSIHSVTSTVYNRSACAVSERYFPRLQRGLSGEHFCIGNELFLVPGSCDLLRGSPLEQWLYKGNNDYHHTMVLNLFGRDCGFGEHVIGTRLSSHVRWMESVLLPKSSGTGALLRYVDPDLHIGDNCSVIGGTVGRCMPLDACPVPRKDLLHRGSVLFCTNTSVVCCGVTESNKNDRIHPELVSCSHRIQGDPNGAIVSIGWLVDRKLKFRCSGSIISRKTVLVSASCLANDHPHIIQLITTSQRFEVASVMKHPAYNAIDNTNDIALITLSRSLIWNSNVFPACLWMNTTHTPIVMNMIFPNAQMELINNRVHPMYNSDCARSHPHHVPESQMCVRNPYRKTNCVEVSSQLVWWDNQKLYLIGLPFNTNECVGWMSYTMLTRISFFIEWISANAEF